MTRRPFTALLAAALALASAVVHAQTFPVCTAGGDQLNVSAISDGADGVYVAWKDGRNTTDADVYAIRLKADGQVVQGWPPTALQLASTVLAEAWPKLLAAPDGGAYVTWAIVGLQLRAQRLGADGAPMWGAGGLLLSDNQTQPADGSFTSMAPAANGGLFVIWPAGAFSRAQMTVVTADGSLPAEWRSLLDVSGGLPYTRTTALASDGAGGVYVLRNARDPNSAFTGVDLFVRHFSPYATPYPEPAGFGRLVGTQHGDADMVEALGDGTGGVYVTWYDTRRDQGDIYATRLDLYGLPMPGWPDTGRVVCAATGLQSRPRLAVAPNGDAVIAWTDHRGTTDDVGLMRLRPDGSPAPGWVEGGTRMAAAGDQNTPSLAALADGSVMLAWRTTEAGQSDIRAMRVFADGRSTPGLNGEPVATAAGWNETDPVVVPVLGDRAIVIWRDYRAGIPTEADLYGAQVNLPVVLDAGPAPGLAFALHGAEPQPARAHALRLAFTLPDASPARLELFDVSGRRVAAADVGALGAGRHAWTPTPDVAFAPGVLLARLTRPGEVRTARVVVVR